MEGKEDAKVGANKFPAPLFEPGELSSWSFHWAGIAEFIATFLFLYITVLTVMGVYRALKKCASVGIQGIAWAFGGMIFALVYCTSGFDRKENDKQAKSNFSNLEKLGASHLHGVDETQMKFHSNFPMQVPHAGFDRKENDKQAKSNFSNLEKLGDSHLHGVDETQMKFHSNFPIQVPHAGFHRKENDEQVKSNFSNLEKSGPSHLHGVDETQMKFHSNFPMQVPRAGFHRKENDEHAKLNFSNLEKLVASYLHGLDETQMKFHSNFQMQVPDEGFHRKENDKHLIRRERWIKHYSSSHKILLVGEGDFSFSKCLASAFGTAVNMTATSLDNRECLAMNYSSAIANVEELENLGCTIIHGVNAHTMKHHSKLSSEFFDRIVFNFPHSGFRRKPEKSSHMIKRHRKLVRGFLRNAREMLTKKGQIHITHKTAYPFSEWNIEELAEEEGLRLVKRSPFYISEYDGYTNKKGQGMNCNKSFPVGDCCTFKFVYA